MVEEKDEDCDIARQMTKRKGGKAGPVGTFDPQRHEVTPNVEGSPIRANLDPSRPNTSAPKITLRPNQKADRNSDIGAKGARTLKKVYIGKKESYYYDKSDSVTGTRIPVVGLV
jgi:hypothetical protein